MTYLCGMITLARHIELLLLEHDCVIVPGLGGFIANHADAQYVGGEEHLFLPPYRTIGFNQQLQVNDGLLVQSYMAAYDTSYPFANLQMEQDLGDMLHELEMQGLYTLENLGTLRKGLNQNITFTPQTAGALTPSLYGLYSCGIKSLQSVIKEKEIERNLQAAASMHIAQSDKQTEEKPRLYGHDVVIRLNRRWLDVGIAAAAAVLLFFCISYPTIKNAGIESDTVVATFSPMKSVVKPAATHKNDTHKAVNQTAVAPMKEQKTANANVEDHSASTKATQPTAAVAEANGKFTIVLASYVNQENAERFLEQLAKDGYKEGRYVKEGKMSRILYSSYGQEEEARRALAELKGKNSAFADAWLLAL